MNLRRWQTSEGSCEPALWGGPSEETSFSVGAVPWEKLGPAKGVSEFPMNV